MFGALVHIDDLVPGGPSPISIGDDVWIAHGAIVGPGVTIGNNAVVGAGSVVLSDAPAFSLAVGNPATCSPLLPNARDAGHDL